MNKDLLKILRCPKTGQSLLLENAEYGQDDRIKSGVLISEDKQNMYLIKNYIPRFAPESNYADNFGWQWNKFKKTQLDSYSGHSISATRFWGATEWKAKDLKGEWVLDIGCGAGRFAEISLNTGARIIAIDYSFAVEACFDNLKNYQNLDVIQADIYELPFEDGYFNFIYSLGVLQHTPDVQKAFSSLSKALAIGGHLCVDFYEKSWKMVLMPKYWLRPISKRMLKKRLFTTLKILVPKLLIVSNLIRNIPIFGKILKHIIPVANYSGKLPLNKQQLVEWALLDTFDWLSPEYDNPQSAETIKVWFKENGFTDFEILQFHHLVGRGIKS